MSEKFKRIIGSLRLSSNIDEVALVFHLSRHLPGNHTMIDVGAHYGTSLRNFVLAGWQVYAFEPDKANREKLEKFASNYSNLSIDARAISDKDGEIVPFYTSEISTGISGLSRFHESHKQTSYVKTVTLATYCEEQAIKSVDFLKIDAEGYDLIVLKSLAWSLFKPDIIICEFEDSKTIPLEYNFCQLAQFLRDKGYNLLVSEWFPIVQYGTQHKWRDFKTYPCELYNKDAWGNIIAVRDIDSYSKLLKYAKKQKRWCYTIRLLNKITPKL